MGGDGWLRQLSGSASTSRWFPPGVQEWTPSPWRRGRRLITSDVPAGHWKINVAGNPLADLPMSYVDWGVTAVTTPKVAGPSSTAGTIAIVHDPPDVRRRAGQCLATQKLRRDPRRRIPNTSTAVVAPGPADGDLTRLQIGRHRNAYGPFRWTSLSERSGTRIGVAPTTRLAVATTILVCLSSGPATSLGRWVTHEQPSIDSWPFVVTMWLPVCIDGILRRRHRHETARWLRLECSSAPAIAGPAWGARGLDGRFGGSDDLSCRPPRNMLSWSLVDRSAAWFGLA